MDSSIGDGSLGICVFADRRIRTRRSAEVPGIRARGVPKVYDGSVKTPISALRFVTRHGGDQ